MTVEDAMREGRALTDNELAIDWAFLKTQNDMLKFEVAWWRSLHRNLHLAVCWLIAGATFQAVALVLMWLRS